MTHGVLVPSPGHGRRADLPPATLAGVAPILLAAGVVLAIAGLTDVGLFYWPMRFGDAEWEFGVVAQTFDALPLPTLGLVLVAIGLLARGGRRRWGRVASLVFFGAGACLAVLAVLFLLDVPLALAALGRSGAAMRARGLAPNPALAGGLYRSIGKAVGLAATYVAGYATIGVRLWRGPRIARPAPGA